MNDFRLEREVFISPGTIQSPRSSPRATEAEVVTGTTGYKLDCTRSIRLQFYGVAVGKSIWIRGEAMAGVNPADFAEWGGRRFSSAPASNAS
jgi:hypothetical protein